MRRTCAPVWKSGHGCNAFLHRFARRNMENPHTCYESFVPFEDLGVAQTWLPLRLCTLIPPSHAQPLETLHTCSESFVTSEKLKACAITRAPQDPQLRMRALSLVIAIFVN